MPNVVELLQHPGGDLSSCAALRQGYGVALRQSLLHPAAIDNLEEGAGALQGGCDEGGRHRMQHRTSGAGFCSGVALRQSLLH